MPFVVMNQDFLEPLCKAIGVDMHKTRRIILDLQIGLPAKAYVETFADTSVLTINYPDGWEIQNDAVPDSQ